MQPHKNSLSNASQEFCAGKFKLQNKLSTFMAIFNNVTLHKQYHRELFMTFKRWNYN